MKKVIYLWLVSVVTTWGSRFKTPKRRSVFFQSFSNQTALILPMAAAAKKAGEQFVVFMLPQAKKDAAVLEQNGVQVVIFTDGFSFLFKWLAFAANSRLIFCDNYFAFLGGVKLAKKTRVVQLWHANGAIKTFGWQEARTMHRSNSDKRRFQQVYNRFDEIIVGSSKMAQVFCDSYHLPQDSCIALGYPRSDRLFDREWYENVHKNIYTQIPQARQKEVIVYAPTYRETADGNIYFELPADFAAVVDHLVSSQLLVIKLHPHVADYAKKIAARFGDKVICDFDFTTEDWLCVCDCLITDYSSVIFDYAVLPNAKRMLFYLFDQRQYEQVVGLQADMYSWLPGKVATDGNMLAKLLQTPEKNPQLAEFNALWNTYNDGHATERLCQRYFSN